MSFTLTSQNNRFIDMHSNNYLTRITCMPNRYNSSTGLPYMIDINKLKKR